MKKLDQQRRPSPRRGPEPLHHLDAAGQREVEGGQLLGGPKTAAPAAPSAVGQHRMIPSSSATGHMGAPAPAEVGRALVGVDDLDPP